MLERAAPCLEPALQNLFRSVEAPTRSQRRLPHAFWRHARIAQDHTSWWPAYLDDIRRISQVREGIINSSLPPRKLARVPPFTSPQWLVSERSTTPTTQGSNHGARRHISKVVKQTQTRERQEFEDALQITNQTTRPVDINIMGPEHIPEPLVLRSYAAEMTPSERLQGLIRSGSEPRFHEVWSTFVSLKDHARLARPVLRYLSRSPDSLILRRALRIFQTIEVQNRTQLTYESAVRAYIGLRKYSTANQVVLEALESGLGQESAQLLMCHLVEKEMWKSAEQTLRVFTDHTRSESFNTTTTNEHVLRNLREAPVWKRVDDMLALPRKLIALCKRLQGGDSVLALNKSGIEYFATRLLERTLRSTKIMAVITPEGVLALLEIFRELKLLHFEHYLDALSALRNLRDSRNRSQLALLIFRNMRWRYPKRRLRDSTYGTMISILSAAPNEPQTFDYILQDLTRAAPISSSIAHNRKPELAMYQRIMATCADQGHVTYVDELLQRLIRDHGVPRELAYFTPSLLSRAKRGDVDQTRSCFADLSLKYNLEPNAHCWNILLLAYAKADDFQGAAAVFREMQDFGVDADSYTFGTLMSICSNAGDTAAVLELVNLARERHISASTAMIDTIVHAYCMNEEVRQAENLVEAATQMELSGPPTRMWNTLLRHHAFRGDSASMLRTQERMRELAIQPDGMTYAALMTSLVVMGDTKQAAAVLRSLHLSQVVTISRFHYSIILHGYVREGQRDLATAIYSEMLERFHQPSPSARLAMMHLQSQRDDLKARSRATNAALEWTGRPQTFTDPLQRHSIDFLADALVEIAETEAVPTEPQPGFQRRRPSLASSAIYIEVAFSMLARGAAYGKAKVLLTRYEAMLNKSTGSKQQKSAQTVQLLTAQMQGLIRSLEGSGLSTERYSDQSRTQLDGIWTRILDQAILAHGERDLGLLDEPLIAGPSEIKPVGGSESLSVKLNPTPVANLVKIIPASRYALAAPLSVYIRGLALQRRFSELEDELRRVQNLGFELNGKTWNTYVQVLSREHDTVLQAFRTFEEKLLPNAPPWNVLKRGKLLFTGLEPSSVEANAPSRIGQIPVPRSLVEKRQPGHLIPTYFTVVHLAAAYIKSYLTRPEAGDDKISLYAELRQQAPGTTKLIKDMPYLKDRVQGVLLRGRSVKGDPVKRIRESPRLDRIGLLGSDALLDGISPEQIDALEMSKESEEEMLSLINEIERPVTRSPLVSAKRRVSENQDTYERRVAKEEAKHKALTRRLLEESHNKEVHTVADETVGDPHVDGLPPEELDNTIVAEKNTAIAPSPTNNNTPTLSPLRKHAQSLRALSKNPGNIHKPWKIVPRRKQQPRIIPYASKQPGYFLKPMGDYFHQSLVFTKPMLSLDVPRRRELGSEQRAFTREKTMLALRKERHAEVARAQARKKRDELDRRWRGTNEIGFLEARLVRDSEVMRGTDASGDTMSQQTEAAFEVHVDEQRTRSGPADAATLREARTLDPELRRGLISSYGSDDVDDTDFLPLNRGAGEQPQTLTQEDTGDVPNDAGEGQDATFSTKAPEQHNAAEEVAVPYSGLPVEGFGESDFVDYMRPQSERRSVPSGSR